MDEVVYPVCRPIWLPREAWYLWASTIYTKQSLIEDRLAWYGLESMVRCCGSESRTLITAIWWFAFCFGRCAIRSAALVTQLGLSVFAGKEAGMDRVTSHLSPNTITSYAPAGYFHREKIKRFEAWCKVRFSYLEIKVEKSFLIIETDYAVKCSINEKRNADILSSNKWREISHDTRK